MDKRLEFLREAIAAECSLNKPPGGIIATVAIFSPHIVRAGRLASWLPGR